MSEQKPVFMQDGSYFYDIHSVDEQLREKVKYDLQLNDHEFVFGRWVYCDFNLNNESDINFCYTNVGHDFGQLQPDVNKWYLVDENDHPVPQTRWGKTYFDNDLAPKQNASLVEYGNRAMSPILAGENYSLSKDIPLNRLFDLSAPGKYKAKALRSSFSPGDDVMLDPPLESNTVEFRICDGPEFWKTDMGNDPPIHALIMKPELFEDLSPAGDYYGGLRLLVRCDQQSYGENKSVFVHSFVKNESKTDIHLCIDPGLFWQAQRWILTDEKGKDVPMTSLGRQRYEEKTKPDEKKEWKFTDPCFVILPPGKEVEITPGAIRLNRYYDVTLPGKYKLKALRSCMIPGQKNDPPKVSNTIGFEMQKDDRMTPEDLKKRGFVFEDLGEKE